MGKPKFKYEIETLIDDASKIVTDISSLSKTVGSVGKEMSGELAEEVSRRAEQEIEAIKKRMHELEERGKQYAATVDSHVKQNPYLYIMGFLGLGLLLGKFATPKHR